MKRWARRIAVLPLIGVVANLLVAWGLTLWAPVLGHDSIRFEESGRIWRETFVETVGHDGMLHLGMEFRFRGYRCREIEAFPSDEVVERGRIAEAGWPLPSFSGQELETREGAQYFYALRAPDIPAPYRLKDPRRRLLTFRPMWPGIAINTMCYAAAALAVRLLVAWLGAVRRWWRLRRGVCPRCRYPLGQGPACSECGAALPIRP